MLPFARSHVKEWWCEPLELRCVLLISCFVWLLARKEERRFHSGRTHGQAVRDWFVFRVSVERGERRSLYSSYHRYYLMPDKGQKMDLEVTIVFS